MMSGIGIYGFVIGTVYILVIAFLVWLTFRFVKAHESLAEGVRRLTRILEEQKRETNRSN